MNSLCVRELCVLMFSWCFLYAPVPDNQESKRGIYISGLLAFVGVYHSCIGGNLHFALITVSTFLANASSTTRSMWIKDFHLTTTHLGNYDAKKKVIIIRNGTCQLLTLFFMCLQKKFYLTAYNFMTDMFMFIVILDQALTEFNSIFKLLFF